MKRRFRRTPVVANRYYGRKPIKSYYDYDNDNDFTSDGEYSNVYKFVDAMRELEETITELLDNVRDYREYAEENTFECFSGEEDAKAALDSAEELTYKVQHINWDLPFEELINR